MHFFRLDQKQLERLAAWQATHNPETYHGAIAGAYTYCFTDTTLGRITKVKYRAGMPDEQEIDLTDYTEF